MGIKSGVGVLAGVTALLVSGCSGGGGRGGSAATTVSGVAVAERASGLVPVEFVLVDPEGDPTDVEVRYSVDGGATFAPAAVREATTALATSPDGTRHLVHWDAYADLGARAAVDFEVTVTPLGGGDDPTRTAVIATSGSVLNVPSAARRVEQYLIHFGPMDASKVAVCETFDLVILYSCHPSITRSLVAAIQDGVDPADPSDDVLVLGYVNVGEDERTIGLTASQLQADPRFVGDGTGPRVDPRGAGAAGQPLTGLDPLGLPSVSGGYASFYLDDNSLESNGVGDGVPDRNSVTGACYVNMGDPAWFDALDAMECAGPDGRNGFRELLTLGHGLGLGCDGVYLDNVDTCAPNLWTGPSDPDQAEFEWTAAGYGSLVDRLRAQYPEALILQNRGLFFFHPDLPHYEVAPRRLLDFVKIENYRLDRNSGQEFDAYTFAANKHSWGPKLQAEAYRDRGFQILSLGYAEGPGIDHATLTGNALGGLSTLLDDVREAQEVAGYRHYIHDAAGSVLNRFVADHGDLSDTAPPVWTSTYNVNDPGYPTPPGAPQPRVGIQQAVAEPGAAVVRWDVARDLNPVRYVLYHSDRRYRSNQSDRWFERATRIEMLPAVGEGYENGVGPAVFPYEYRLDGLRRSTSYWLAVRAVDSAGNEDDNRVVLRVTTPDDVPGIVIDGDFDDWLQRPIRMFDWRTQGTSGGPDWQFLQVANDDTNLYIRFRSWDRFDLDGSPQHATSQFAIYLDADNDPFSGRRRGLIGSELLVHGDELVADTGATAGQVLQTLPFLPQVDIRDGELSVPLAAVDAAAGGGPATRIRLLFVDLASGDRAPEFGYLPYDVVR